MVLIRADDELLTPEQLAEKLQVKTSWVYENTRCRAEVRNADPLPYRRMGRYLRFSWQEVIDWLNRQHRSTANENKPQNETPGRVHILRQKA